LNYIRHTDWLGSSRLATTWAHAVYSKEAYAPFGESYFEAGAPDRSFTGQDQDVASGPGGTGVYDFLFRKYDPSAGRWLSPDPYGWGAVRLRHPQSLNRYAYVENDPLRLVDPTGLDHQCTDPAGNLVSVPDEVYCTDVLLQVDGVEPLEIDSGPQKSAPTNDVGDDSDFNDSMLDLSKFGAPYIYPSADNSRGGAPNNNTPQEPQKKHCSANQRIGGAVKALEAAGDVSIALNLAYIHVAAAGALVGFGCLEPTPFEPVTCAASGFGGAALLGGGVVMSKMAVLEVEEGVIPGVKEMFCTE
jgi:RHS repeat-associated protein